VVFIVDYGWLFDHALHCLRFLLEIISLMDILDYPFVLVLNVLDLLLQILKLHMKGLDLLNPTGVSTLPHWLSN
jgi:hypothetical protein